MFGTQQIVRGPPLQARHLVTGDFNAASRSDEDTCDVLLHRRVFVPSIRVFVASAAEVVNTKR
jgi:hypothetical protein